MREQRGKQAAASFLFKLAESVGTQGISFVVSVVLARLLDPSDYGVLTMLTVFIAVSQVFVQSGLNTALIQKKDVDETDLSSVFYVSLGIAVVLYGLLFLLAPAIGAFFAMEALAPVLRVLALILLPGALISVQNAVIAREMAFRRLMTASLICTTLSGVVGIAMAAAGTGYWALVAQQLTSQLSLALVLLWLVKWRPRALFSWARVRGLIRFGWKLLASSLLETGYNNLRTAVIGKKYAQETLGFYNRGKQFPELVMNAVNGSIQSVMLPVLADVLVGQYPAFERQGWEPHVDFQDEALLADADPEALARIFENLVVNALRHGVSAPTIEQRGGTVTFANEVSDPAALDVERLFERFYRADVSRTSPGSGLGLAVAASLAEAMGMRLDARLEGATLRMGLELWGC